MEVTLFLFALGYLTIILVGVIWAITWSSRRGYGAAKTGAVVLGVLCIIYAIPFGDYTIGLIRFNRLCKEQAGTKIHQVVENVDGYLRDSGRGPQRPSQYTTNGYPFLEQIGFKGEIFRYTRRDDGSVVEEKIDHPRSKYVFRRIESAIGADITKNSSTIVEVSSNQVLASHTVLYYQGGWFSSFYGGPGLSRRCPREDSIESRDLVSAVLKPRDHKE